MFPSIETFFPLRETPPFQFLLSPRQRILLGGVDISERISRFSPDRCLFGWAPREYCWLTKFKYRARGNTSFRWVTYFASRWGYVWQTNRNAPFHSSVQRFANMMLHSAIISIFHVLNIKEKNDSLFDPRNHTKMSLADIIFRVKIQNLTHFDFRYPYLVWLL